MTPRKAGPNISAVPLIILSIIVLFVVGASLPVREKGFLARPVTWAAALVVLALPVVFAFTRGAPAGVFPFDDSYISLAAARNVAEHLELSVVRGRPLQGITSPLHVLLVGLLGAIFGSVEPAARLLSLAAFLFAALGAALYAGRVAGDRRAFVLAGGLCVLGGPMLYDIGSGM